MPAPRKPVTSRAKKPAPKPKPKPVDVHNAGQLKAAIAKNTRKIKVHERAIQTLRKWRATRQAQLKRLQSKRGPAAAAKFALTLVGRHEDAGRPNRASWLDAWARGIGAWMIGQPWCGLLVWIIARHVGLKLDPRTVSTVAIRDMARNGTGGFKAWHPASATPKIGWVPVYGTSGPVHTGFYVGNGRIVEGNTSPSNGGSQNDGGGVYIRSLAERRNWILGWAEPDWSKAR